MMQEQCFWKRNSRSTVPFLVYTPRQFDQGDYNIKTSLSSLFSGTNSDTFLASRFLKAAELITINLNLKEIKVTKRTIFGDSAV